MNDDEINATIDDLANTYPKRFSSRYTPATDLNQAVEAARSLGYRTLPLEVVTAEGELARAICRYLLEEKGGDNG
jgi:hypothetical protein